MPLILKNLWKIVTNPQIIGIVMAIVDIVGSAQVQKILESIRDALKTELPHPIPPPTTEPERERLVKRLFRRLAFNNLGISEQEYAALTDRQHKENIA